MASDSVTTPRRSTRITNRVQSSPKPLSQDLFVYPFTGVNSITITGDDVFRLSEGEFLNDNLVEFYLKYFQNQLIESNPTLADQVHFFNPFFYKRLTQKDKSNKAMNVYDKVKKWTSKINLFSKNYIFIPINENLHWYLALVSNPYLLLPSENSAEKDQSSKTPEKRPGKSWGPNSMEEIGDPNVVEVLELDDVANGEKSASSSRKWENGSSSPWIVIFDSLGARHNTVFKTLNTYLINEAKEKLNTDIQGKAVGVYAKVPCQTNYCDCGLYILQYVETFLKNPSKYLDIVAVRSPGSNRVGW
ncbi:cysteine proteinase [Basidiobolus meristosporus CBS 931.73]|uniref:Cysteine proteinase n=1 Tax=Basidiobolus meristosporus CBS 931.73 TaxID=1314790 RepID=A0A1Y1XRF7_9FUNG|nr:cysteine proteinase [Basidiobolus meristosporus CBS 931.73]|eukprot:ORX88349.1 cysteine proteinase [Basidiobolus meristosporus CBS 931.73]